MSYKQPTCTNFGSNESPIIPLKESQTFILIIYSSQELQLIKHNLSGVEGEVVAWEVVARVHFLWGNAQFQV